MHNNDTATEFVVLTAMAKMPQSCWGNYGRIAVCEMKKGVRPKMISERAIGMVRIVETWERLNIGKTSKCAFQKAMKQAKEMTLKLNA